MATQDILLNAKYALEGLGYLAADVLGTGTYVYGAAVTPTTPTANLFVQVAPGRIYTQAVVDATGWSSLLADSTVITQQGIYLGASFACLAPTTAGYSTNFLFEAQYQQVDSNPAVIPYYNTSNPSQPYSGVGNNGLSQYKTRTGLMVVTLVTGTPAPTGTQTTPAATSGWSPLAVVTVAYGQTQITSSNIALASGNVYGKTNSSGTFTATFTGGTTVPTQTVSYRVAQGIVTLTLSPFSFTSNSTAFTFTGLPAALYPSIGGNVPVPFLTDNSVTVGNAYAYIAPNTSTVAFGLLGNLSGFTASGTKGLTSMQITYAL